ncbi:MAG: hypothetical protein DLM73_00880 [Chthoniobacterales bacterium]|nr:MAG: hypothetical protein DLM73_00880 [Chthoniobacterales bacterium]
MKNLTSSAVAFLLLIVATMAYAAVPAMNVTVSDAGGKAAFKGATDAKGTFATGKLQPGNYVVQINSKSAVKGTYAVVVAAGTKKVAANSVPGEKFAGGGVALKVDVGAGLNITGQVAAEDKSSISKNGKKMVWINKQPGSNLPGHWVEEDSAEAKAAKAAGTLSTQSIQNIQAHQDQHGGN